jgi:type IV secretory pathway VirJ component
MRSEHLASGPQLNYYCLVTYITQEVAWEQLETCVLSGLRPFNLATTLRAERCPVLQSITSSRCHRVMSTANGSTQAINTAVSDAAVPAASPEPSAEPAAVAPPLPDAAAAPAANGAITASAVAAEHTAPPAETAGAGKDQAGPSAEAAGPSEPAEASAEPIPALPENADELLKVRNATCQRGILRASSIDLTHHPPLPFWPLSSVGFSHV